MSNIVCCDESCDLRASTSRRNSRNWKFHFSLSLMVELVELGLLRSTVTLSRFGDIET